MKNLILFYGMLGHFVSSNHLSVYEGPTTISVSGYLSNPRFALSVESIKYYSLNC